MTAMKFPWKPPKSGLECEFRELGEIKRGYFLHT